MLRAFGVVGKEECLGPVDGIRKIIHINKGCHSLPWRSSVY